MVIDVAMHRNKGATVAKASVTLKVSDVSGMPYFVTARKVMQDPVIHVAVGVADEVQFARRQISLLWCDWPHLGVLLKHKLFP